MALGAIRIDSVAFEVVPPVSIFSFFVTSCVLARKGPAACFPFIEGCIGMVPWLGKNGSEFADFGDMAWKGA